ncbi:hypothetical protein ACT3R7_12590 [Halomonas sp. AOP43-A1-21]|uniref:hypothetical protein n=1 Tax=Halomonas colorata TaxID=2742615 RepID=UPI001867FC2A|nr:hypothetical protein [Halomonas colorata]
MNDNVVSIENILKYKRDKEAFLKQYPDLHKWCLEAVEEMIINGEMDEMLARHGFVRVYR